MCDLSKNNQQQWQLDETGVQNNDESIPHMDTRHTAELPIALSMSKFPKDTWQLWKWFLL